MVGVWEGLNLGSIPNFFLCFGMHPKIIDVYPKLIPKRGVVQFCHVQSEDAVNSGVEGDGVVEKTVFASNRTQTIMLPQFLKSPVSSFVPVTSSPSKTSVSGCRLEVPTAPTLWIPT